MVQQTALYCFICQAPKEREATLSGCDHTYCYDCIKQWMRRQCIPKCPLCDSKFDRVFANGRLLTWTRRSGWGIEIKEDFVTTWNESVWDQLPPRHFVPWGDTHQVQWGDRNI